MSYTIFLSLQGDLNQNCPEAVTSYLRWLATGSNDLAPSGDVAQLIETEVDFGTLPEPDWFAEPWGHVAVLPGHTPGHGARIALYGSFHDEFVQHLYALLNVIAKHASNGPLASSWNTLGDHASARTYFAYDGILFGADTGDSPFPMSNTDPDALPPVDRLVSNIEPGFFTRHGLDARAEGLLIDADPQEAVVARYLLARTIWRAVSAAATPPGVGVADPEMIRSIVGSVLAALDLGSDDLASPTSPGWVVAETRSRGRGDSRRRTGRVASQLAAMMDFVDEGSSTAGPTRLESGMRLIALTDFVLTATSGRLVERVGGGRSAHRLTVEVPIGASLTIGQVFDAGHASCVNDDWPTWDSQLPNGETPTDLNPAKPLGDPSDYRLGYINPGDDGTLWRIE